MGRPRSFVLPLAGALALAGGILAAGPAGAASTIVVQPGESVQAALDAARPGDTVVLRPGSYRENVEIRTSNVTVVGQQATLRPGAQPRNTLCNEGPDHVVGICAFGDVDVQTGAVLRTLRGVTVRGLTVAGFSGDGMFLYGAHGTTVASTVFADNGGYGVFSNNSSGTTYRYNVSRGNGDAGFYVGDSHPANATVVGNRSFDNAAEGILLRSAVSGRVEGNVLAGNCIGLLVLDVPGRAGDWTIVNNTVTKNTKACSGEPDEGIPPLSGAGIVLAGGFGNTVLRNHVTDNSSAAPSAFTGGIAVLSTAPFGFGGPANNNTVRLNRLSGNGPDLSWDGTGHGNTFALNSCATSSPAGLCDGP